jgi:hypothetical protein
MIIIVRRVMSRSHRARRRFQLRRKRNEQQDAAGGGRTDKTWHEIAN